MAQGSQSIMMTWESLSLKEKTFIPKISKTVKTVLLQHYLIVFNFNFSSSEQITVFDLKEKQWLKVKMDGDNFDLKDGSSVCLYDDENIVVFGTDGKQEFLSILSFNRGFDGMQICHDLTILQNGLFKSHHSANIVNDQIYLYGGCSYMNKNMANGDLSVIDLKTFKITPNLSSQVGDRPGGLYGHSSISKDNKIYIYGGISTHNQHIHSNPSIFLFDIETFRWAKVDYYRSQVACPFQAHENHLYFFGGSRKDPSNILSIYDTSKNSKQNVAMKGDVPPATSDCFSAVYENKMFIFGGWNQQTSSRNLETIYWLNLNFKPVNSFIKEVVMKKALDFKEDNKETEALQGVKKLLDENKDPDIIFKIQNKKISAHKNILSFRSSYFSKMFSSGMQESQSKEIFISDISASAFEALIEYFYKGTLPSEQDVLKELLVYSEKILLKRLRLHCERALIKQITKENASELYKLSKISESEDLREAALQFMGNHLSYFIDHFTSLEAKQ